MSNNCPSCGKIIAVGQLECAFCGIIFEKWTTRESRLEGKSRPPENNITNFVPDLRSNRFKKYFPVFGMLIATLLVLKFINSKPKPSILPEKPKNSLESDTEKISKSNRNLPSSIGFGKNPGLEVKTAFDQIKNTPCRVRTEYSYPPSNNLLASGITSQITEFSPPETFRILTSQNIYDFITKSSKFQTDESFMTKDGMFIKNQMGHWIKTPGGMGAIMNIFSRLDELYQYYTFGEIALHNGQRCAVYNLDINEKRNPFREKVWIGMDTLLPVRREIEYLGQQNAEFSKPGKVVVSYEYPGHIDIVVPVIYENPK